MQEELIIRNFNPGDWPDLYEYLSQPETVKYEPYDVLTQKQAIREAASRSENPCYYAVCLKESGKLIGNCYLEPQEYGCFEIGFVFNANYRKRGYATRSARALMSRAFELMGANRVIACCNPENRDSYRLMERLGMRREAHFVKNIYFQTDGEGKPIW